MAMCNGQKNLFKLHTFHLLVLYFSLIKMTACVWNGRSLSLSPAQLSELPDEATRVLKGSSNVEYLDALADLALQPQWTGPIFAQYQPLFGELCGRWRCKLENIPSLALPCVLALSRILPCAAHVSIMIEDIVCRRRLGVFSSLGPSANAIAVLQLPESTLSDVLLIFLRLLQCDQQGYISLVSPTQLQLLLSHKALHIRFLASKCLCVSMHFTEKAFVSLVDKYVGVAALDAEWEGKIVDYRFLDLWEAKRIEDLRRVLCNSSGKPNTTDSGSDRVIQPADLSPLTQNFAGYLASVPQGDVSASTAMIPTPASSYNLAIAAKAICESRAVLVSGLAGSGKTTILKEIAKHTNQLQTMLTLHLNEQTDAKLLVGVHTTSIESGSFKWQAGILTTAVTEGRWVLIEDLDRAPIEVVSILLPLLDRQELMVPNLGGVIHASPGFKLIATVRSQLSAKHEQLDPAANMIGYRHWNKVNFQSFSEIDLQHIIDGRFPLLRRYCAQFLEVYRALVRLASDGRSPHDSDRPCGPQEILKFCSRVNKVLKQAGISHSEEAIPEVIQDQIFLEAIDCFSSNISNQGLKSQIAEIIAKELQVSESRMRFCIRVRKPGFRVDTSRLEIGRVLLRRTPAAASKHSATTFGPNRKFATTRHTLRTMEAIAAAVRSREPCLLVGETGTGKTTSIQELARLLGHRLVVVNMSQQSEAGDLLGGLKPVNMKTIATPVKDEFDMLFEETFSSAKNERYRLSVERAYKRNEWSKLYKLWEEALKMIGDTFSLKAKNHAAAENPQKKRKVESAKYQKLKIKWDMLATQIEVFGKHLRSGSKGFAFAFVEGNIVKAARNGDWVLLDEINLATPDTLESLADLLTDVNVESPSLLLTETGEAQKIQAHANFRIFGAMNPATDVGKKNLPPSIRSRFTEYNISSPEEDQESLQQIVQTYIGDYGIKDHRLAQKVMKLYVDVRQLELTNQLVDGAGQRPHFTLRTLNRALAYANEIAHIYGYRRSLYEGFAMSFLTALDRHSILLVRPLIINLSSTHPNVEALLRQVPRCPGLQDEFIQFRHYWLPRGPFSPREQQHYIITPFVEDNLLNLVRATSAKHYPILLQGPTSSGKTSMVEYLAGLSGNKLVRINNHEYTDLQEYLGTYISGPKGLQFQEGALVRALREGYWLVLDELNLAPTDILEALNRLLDDNRELFLPETQEVVRPHNNFMLFATQNPPGLYGGRKVLSRAFRNRFLELHFDDIPEDELETILRERSQIAPSYCTRIVEVYKKLALLRQSNRLFEQRSSFATLRDLFRWALRRADNPEQLAVNGFMLLAERVRDAEERQMVKQVIEEVMRLKIDEKDIYRRDNLPKASGWTNVSITESTILTKSMIRLLSLISRSLENNEPVLLVGETGCGKTTACQMIAELFGTELHILNAHQNTETGDLIGAQRPVRNKQQINALLCQDLATIPEIALLGLDGQRTNTTKLIEAYTALSQDIKGNLSWELRNRIEANLARANALFEWSDGNLVRAMKLGHHFLLDEISLADDSVLERLNSVLEPSRSIFLAEKGSLDSLVVAGEKFRFLATMNPGGDYGKKELSPALRNRFTEIWVPLPNDNDDILQIAVAKLTPRLSGLAGPIVSFSRWFEQQYHGSASSLSLRQVLSWIDFLNLVDVDDISFSIVHGGAMVYMDALGANPSGKLRTSREAVSQERKACLDTLSSVFNLDAAATYFRPSTLDLEGDHLSIEKFTILKRTAQNKIAKLNLRTPTTLKNIMRIARALQLPKPILIEGNPGVGKSTLVGALADIVGVKLTRLNLSEQTDVMDLFGSDVPVEDGEAGQFQWRDAPFLQAMQRGEWVLLDEMNLASQSILEGLNACLDHRGQIYVPELDRIFTRHPDFKLFAAQNPYNQGGGRKGLPTSFVNRFTVVYADVFTEQDLLSISTELYPKISGNIASRIIEYVAKLERLATQSNTFSASGTPWEFNLRDVLRWLHLLSSKAPLLSGAQPSDLEQMLFQNRFRSREDTRTVQTLVQSTSNASPNFHTYFRNTSPDFFQCGFGSLGRCNVASSPLGSYLKHDPRIVESVLIAIQTNWPCLLVGPSGSGKSSLIQDIAAIHGARISILPLNADMDTLDLVGGYEQVDYKRHAAKLLSQIQELLADHIVQQIVDRLDVHNHWYELLTLTRGQAADVEAVSDRLGTFAGILPHKLELLRSQCQSLMQRKHLDNRARFEWVDSVLIEAMERGHWLVLDNANLCSSSVLDRLNALLEPGGILSVNEHRSADGSPKIIVPHQGFRVFLTMNPRYGELSRAMRNRCVELYLSGDRHSRIRSLEDLQADATLSRFQAIQLFDWNAISTDGAKTLAEICVENLALADFAAFVSWRREASRGLIDIASSRKGTLLQTFETLEQYTKNSSIISAIYELYTSMFPNLGETPWTHNAHRWQPLNPLNNAPLMSQLHATQQLDKAIWLADALHCIFKLADVLDHLANFDESQNRKNQAIATRSRANENETTNSITKFLQLASNDVLSWTQQAFSDPRSTGDYPSAVTHYILDIFNLARAVPFDKAKFQIYLRLGRRLSYALRSNEPSSEVGQTLLRNLCLFDEDWKMTSGFGMEALWLMFRPAVPPNAHILEHILALEASAKTFDGSAWKSFVSLRHIIKLRESLLSALLRLSSSNDRDYFEHFGDTEETSSDLCEVFQAIAEESASLDIDEKLAEPYFLEESECLGQFIWSSGHQPSVEDRAILDLITLRPIQISTLAPSSQSSDMLLNRLQRITGADTDRCRLSAWKGTFTFSLVEKLLDMPEIPLRSLERLGEEAEVFTRQLTNAMQVILADQSLALREVLSTLLNYVVKALGASLPSEFLSDWEPVLHSLDIKEQGFVSLPQLLTGSTAESGLTDALRLTVLRYFQPAVEYLLNTKSSEDLRSREIGYPWLSFFIGCVTLYVPNAPFDPAMHPTVEAERWSARKRELQLQLDALEVFEERMSGQRSNLRCDQSRQRLHSMGQQPSIPAVSRPSESKLMQLQEEFNAILQIVVPSCETFMSSIRESTAEQGRTIQGNIKRIITRLTDGYREYDDIVKPLIGFLNGVNVGLDLCASGTVLAQEDAVDINPQSTVPNLLGLSLHNVLFLASNGSQSQHFTTPESRMLSLEYAAIRNHINGSIDPSLTVEISEIFKSLHKDWRVQLQNERAHEAAKSTMYRYKGQDTASPDIDAEVESLFPGSLDKEKDQPVEKNPGYTDPKASARSLAQLHKNLFSKELDLKSAITGFAAGLVEKLRSLVPAYEYSLMQSSTLLPSLILSVHNHTQYLTSMQKESASRQSNFYHESNVIEARKLLKLLHGIKNRFRLIHTTWPDHSTPVDVLRTIDELLDFRHTCPLAKLVTKVEKLHSYVYQWQEVASREFSVQRHYDELTKLLISWRRIELSSWATLLDREEDNHKGEAQSWWFILYEAIFPTDEDLHAEYQGYLEPLLIEVQGFIQNAPLGQYSARLDMIATFAQHTRKFSQHFPAFVSIATSLVNVVKYFSRWVNTVQSTIRKEREQLAQRMKDVMLMASWKDTNIPALRESARKSHYSLLKIVRKYRDVLAQPVEGHLREQTDMETTSTERTIQPHNHKQQDVDKFALDSCQRNLINWSHRASRLHNPNNTANLIAQISSETGAELDSKVFITSFQRSLSETIKILRRETPSDLTEDNKSYVKHLRARKRNLLADTLKELRHMGVRSNLDVKTLENQRGPGRFFSYIRPAPELAPSESAFFGFLDSMSLARKATKRHSEDLTPSEISRCIGSLEGLLDYLIKQRHALGEVFIDIEAFDNVLANIGALWNPAQYEVKLEADGIPNAAQHVQRVRWLQAILSSTDAVIEKFEEMGGVMFSTIREGLQQWITRLKHLQDSMQQLPRLPAGLVSSLQERAVLEVDNICEELHTDLRRWNSDYPTTKFVLIQIEPWLRRDMSVGPSEFLISKETFTQFDESREATSGANASREFDHCRIFNIVDSMLVGMQKLKDVFEHLPASIEEPGWLIREELVLRKASADLQLARFTTRLSEELLLTLQRCQPGELMVACALGAVILPIIQEYRNACNIVALKRLATHEAACRLSWALSSNFSELVQNGFCSPQAKSGKETESGKTEEGIGLGEGEGAEDISGQIGEDEDLSELAQEPSSGSGREKEETADEDRAVDVVEENLEGQVDEGTESADAERGGQETEEGEDADVSEEVGSVDDLDPSAVDEKLWGSKADQKPAEKDGDASGEKSDDLLAPQERSDENEATEHEANEMDSGSDVEGHDMPAQIHAEQLDPNLEQDEKLDLPEDIDVNATNLSPPTTDDEDLEDLSDGEGTEVDSSKGLDPESDVDMENADEPHNEEAADKGDSGHDLQTLSGASQSEHNEGETPRNNESLQGVETAQYPTEKPQDNVEASEIQGEQTINNDQITNDDSDDEANKLEAKTTTSMAQNNKGKGDSRGSQGRSTSNNLPSQRDPEDLDRQPFRKLAEALAKWHRTAREIQNPMEKQRQEVNDEVEPTGTGEFEHLQNQDDAADAQALGTAAEEEEKGLTEQEMQIEQINEYADEDLDGMQDSADSLMYEDPPPESEWADPGRSTSFVPREGTTLNDYFKTATSESQDSKSESTLDEIDIGLSDVQLSSFENPQLSLEDARRLWSHIEKTTREFSMSLTEQLRLILAPSQATKMRGDFRTGKRLNVKRIIPYIASQYKRDKIWMRRSIPSKRNYQVMIAVDDSKSMAESGSARLALESLVLLSRSLSQLEVGQISVASFGEDFRIAHPFDRQFSNDSAVNVIQHFRFQQRETQIRSLLIASLDVFRQARAQQTSSSANLWQLQLIVSDGVCPKDENIKRLVRQAHEEQIMIVFAIVNPSTSSSIVDMTEAIFETDQNGESHFEVKRYLDGFPFPYYLVIRELRNLPNVLSVALRQWFTEVSNLD